jgi:GWxTD domain-containing protein
MTFLETFVETPWAAALGWTLLHSLWEGALIAAVPALVMLATKSPRVRYAAACLAMLAILAAFGVTLFHFAPYAVHQPRPMGRLPFPAWKHAVVQTTNKWSPTLAAIAPWLAPFWMAGVFVFYLRYTAGFLSVSRLRKRGVCSAPEAWQTKLEDLAAQLRVSRPVVLLESSLADAPMVIGHIRPLILMPVGLFTGLPAAQIESILLHELAHICRHDFLVNSIQNLLDGILFYHPAVWWISHVVRAEREKCCDDVVVRISGNAHEYARALAGLEETRWSGREPALAAKGGSLMKRIRRLLYPPAQQAGWLPIASAGLLLLTIAVTLGAWESSTTTVPQSSADLSTVSSDAYAKWLNEDVVYIIDDAERAAFLKLRTDEERTHFIEQFWERRNPMPGSAENKFKIEHYRRIAFTNKHFASASVPGWQTDRGHMYILYGPPDEIDSHPKGTPHPWESWGYQHMENDTEMSFFRFIDSNGTGNFRLAPSNGH